MSQTPTYTPDQLRAIALYQRLAIFSVLGYALLFMASTALPAYRVLTLSVAGVVGLVAAVCVFFLAIRLFGLLMAILLALLAATPCISLLVLLGINGKATTVLREHGIPVGVFGANLSKLP
jgi:hypothetical protein